MESIGFLYNETVTIDKSHSEYHSGTVFIYPDKVESIRERGENALITMQSGDKILVNKGIASSLAAHFDEALKGSRE